MKMDGLASPDIVTMLLLTRHSSRPSSLFAFADKSFPLTVFLSQPLPKSDIQAKGPFGITRSNK